MRLIALLLILVPSAAWGQLACSERGEVVRSIERDLKQHRHALGVTASGNVVEVYRTHTGAWTMLLNLPDGRACLLGTGEAWQNVDSVTGPKT